jgi:hypothetical protein
MPLIVMRALVPLIVVAAAAAAAPAAAGEIAALACGDVVTADVTLSSSLEGCTTGIVVGADNITIDLNGYSITGSGVDEGAGIEAVGRSGVTVKNGHVRNFADGVRFFQTANSTIANIHVRRTGTGITVNGTDVASHSNGIVGNNVTDSAAGIHVGGGVSARVLNNRVIGVDGVGILCRDTTDVLIQGNRSVRNQLGIVAFFCEASIVDNDASENARTGIFRERSNGLTERNVANRNGQSGINASDSHGQYVGNVTNRNGGAGLTISDTIASHGPFHTVTNHTAMLNEGLGIAITLEGVIDGGGNRAKRNFDPQQCVGVVCN